MLNGRPGNAFSTRALGALNPAPSRIASSSPVPTTASTSGMFLRISSRYRSTRHPATISRRALPPFATLCCTISRMVFTDSCLAASMKLHVFTTRISASSARAVSSPPARSSSPIITSESTRFFGHPSDTKPILGRAPGEGARAPAGCADTIGVSLVASRTVGATLPFYGSFTVPADDRQRPLPAGPRPESCQQAVEGQLCLARHRRNLLRRHSDAVGDGLHHLGGRSQGRSNHAVHPGNLALGAQIGIADSGFDLRS